MSPRKILACLALAGSCCAGAAAGDPAIIAALKQARANFAGVQDYTALFRKQQRVRGVLLDEEQIFVKFKKPFMVYMKWVGAVDRGREVLYVPERYGEKVLAHLGGAINYFTPTFSLYPRSDLAMRRNLRPITESGMENTIELLLDVCERAERRGDLNSRWMGSGNVGGRRTVRFERILPEGKGYPAQRTLVEFDEETKFPISVTSYGWKGELLEKYIYSDLETNAGLTERDFDRSNGDYGFGYFVVPAPPL